jgi:cytoskeleton protein RodZ
VEDSTASATTAKAPAAPVARSIGERLRAGREKSGLSVPAAAEKLHLDPKIIEALEADRFAEVGASVYVRGHLKRYAEFVGEPAVELVNLYNARETRQAPPDLTQVPHPERRADPRRLVMPLMVMGGAGVLVLAIWWALAGSRPTDGRTATSRPTVVVPADPAPSDAQGLGSAVATPASLSTSSTVPAAAPSPIPSPVTTPVAAASKPAEAAPAPAPEVNLRLELTADSWVEVYDSRDQRLYFDVASAGSVQSVSGRGPLRVVLENAAGVRIEVNGQPREIPVGAIEGERARFVVNRSGSLARAR